MRNKRKELSSRSPCRTAYPKFPRGRRPNSAAECRPANGLARHHLPAYAVSPERAARPRARLGAAREVAAQVIGDGDLASGGDEDVIIRVDGRGARTVAVMVLTSSCSSRTIAW